MTHVRGEQTFYRTTGPTGKILAYKATPTWKLVRSGRADIEFRFIRTELHRAGNPVLVDYRATGQFGQMSAPAGRAATTTKFAWHVYSAGQFLESLSCSVTTPTI